MSGNRVLPKRLSICERVERQHGHALVDREAADDDAAACNLASLDAHDRRPCISKVACSQPWRLWRGIVAAAVRAIKACVGRQQGKQPVDGRHIGRQAGIGREGIEGGRIEEVARVETLACRFPHRNRTGGVPRC